jgi:predicted MFS family arabinose efflux permease
MPAVTSVSPYSASVRQAATARPGLAVLLLSGGAIIGGLAIRHVGLWSLEYLAAAIAGLAMAIVPIVARLKGNGDSR